MINIVKLYIKNRYIKKTIRIPLNTRIKAIDSRSRISKRQLLGTSDNLSSTKNVIITKEREGRANLLRTWIFPGTKLTELTNFFYNEAGIYFIKKNYYLLHIKERFDHSILVVQVYIFISDIVFFILSSCFNVNNLLLNVILSQF